LLTASFLVVGSCHLRLPRKPPVGTATSGVAWKEVAAMASPAQPPPPPPSLPPLFPLDSTALGCMVGVTLAAVIIGFFGCLLLCLCTRFFATAYSPWKRYGPVVSCLATACILVFVALAVLFVYFLTPYNTSLPWLFDSVLYALIGAGAGAGTLVGCMSSWCLERFLTKHAANAESVKQARAQRDSTTLDLDVELTSNVSFIVERGDGGRLGTTEAAVGYTSPRHSHA